MGSKLILCLAGVIAGLYLGVGQPAAIAQGAPTKLAGLRSQVASLEEVVAKQGEVLSALEGRIDELTARTQQLDDDGSYYGYVDATQVWSHYCEKGRLASWTQYNDVVVLGC